MRFEIWSPIIYMTFRHVHTTWALMMFLKHWDSLFLFSVMVLAPGKKVSDVCNIVLRPPPGVKEAGLIRWAWQVPLFCRLVVVTIESTQISSGPSLCQIIARAVSSSMPFIPSVTPFGGRCISKWYFTCYVMTSKEVRNVLCWQTLHHQYARFWVCGLLSAVVIQEPIWTLERMRLLSDWIDSCRLWCTISEGDKVSCSSFWLNIQPATDVAVYSK